LPDVESRRLAGDVDAVVEVFAVDGEMSAVRRAGHEAGGGELVVEEAAGVEHAHAVFFDFGGDGAEDGFRVSALEGKENFDRAQVGVQSLEEPFRGDLPGHERVGRAQLAQGAERLAQLADEYQAAVLNGHGVKKFGRGFVLERNQAQRHARAPDGICGEHRVAPLPGDERDGLGGVEIFWKKT